MKRNINGDVLRILALFFVISVHSLKYTDFYNIKVEGPTMLVLNIMRTIFMSCVPIFIILSGYFMSKKEFNKKYLKKINRIILTYLLCSTFCFIFINIIQDNTLGFTIPKYISGILSFSAAPYAWYVNMYFGLFLIIPFLNILWSNLNKKQKHYLLIILFILGILPNSVNIFNFQNISWWLNPASSKAYHRLVPNYWAGPTFIILYYFIGCYFKEYKINISIKKNILLLLISSIIFGLFNYYRNYNALFEWSTFVSNASFEVLIVTILIFNLVLNIKINIKNEKIIKFISKISYLTFGAYLLSAIFDIYFYQILCNHTKTLVERLPYLIIIVPLIFVCSTILSYIVDILMILLCKVYNKISKNIILLISSKKH